VYHFKALATINNPNNFSLWSVMAHLIAVKKCKKFKPCVKLGYCGYWW
jgi:hypothetical protein